MDFSDLLKMGANMIQNSHNESTSNIDTNSITNALSSILGGTNEEIDLSSIISNVANSGLGDVVSSWIGSGDNESIDTDGISNLLGEDKIAQFADNLGIDIETAKDELSNILPDIVDKATNEDSSLVANLLDQVGGAEGLMNLANSFFNKG